ncbi:reverse transcriptase domain-containing protein [Tanacetum coccineum]
MPFRLKNVGATYQRLVDTIFEGQIGRNLEAYVDDMVIKSKTELDLIKDIEETLLMLKKVNMKLNPKKCSFGMEEGLSLDESCERGIPNDEEVDSELPTLTTPIKDEEPMVYLSVANEAVSVVLPVERNGKQMPIHYVSRSLQGAEVNYALMEKLALALVHATRRLRRYFQGHIIKVIKDKPINQILNSQEASGRRAKWAVELGAYGITYAPKNAIKGQVLADFLADIVTGDDPTSKGTPDPEKPSDQKEALESSRNKEEQTAVVPIDEADTWKLYTDGASNDHRSGAGLILIDPEGVEYSYALRLNFSNSNNDAEYEALLAELRIAVGIKVKKMHAFMDSKLVANQVKGPYKDRGEETKKYKEKILEICEGLTKGVLVEELNERSVDMAEVNVIVEEEGRTWMTPIMEYIEKGTLPEDTANARTIRVKDDMIPVTSTWPFRKWGMDIVSPLLKDPGRLKYLIVTVDYFTKWFGVLAVIITNSGTHLINEPFKSWAEGLEIKLISTSVYHPQANRAVKRANQSIMQGIKTRLHQEGTGWVEELPNVL